MSGLAKRASCKCCTRTGTGISNLSRSNIPFRLVTNLQSAALLSRPLFNLRFSLPEESLKKAMEG